MRTIKRFASGEYGRRWYHRFSWLDGAYGAFNHPGKVLRVMQFSINDK